VCGRRRGRRTRVVDGQWFWGFGCDMGEWLGFWLTEGKERREMVVGRKYLLVMEAHG
ncbi:hypothetical protein U1Q18_037613, partial [Sarracenia purpurea var. burkii]